MDLNISMNSLKHLFSFPFHDPRWKEKFLIGTGLCAAGFFIPLLPLLPVAGYGARLLRAGAANSNPETLPEWDDWGDLLLDGLRLTGVGLLFMLPTWFIMIFGFTIYFGSFTFLPFMDASRGGRAAGLLMVYLLSLGLMFLGMGLGTLLSLAASVVIPPAQAHVAVSRRFAALFEFGSWWKVLRANLGGFLLVLLLMFALYFAGLLAWQVMYLTVILCLVAPLLLMPLLFYGIVIYHRLVGQAYREGLIQADAPAVLAGTGTEAPAPVEGLTAHEDRSAVQASGEKE